MCYTRFVTPTHSCLTESIVGETRCSLKESLAGRLESSLDLSRAPRRAVSNSTVVPDADDVLPPSGGSPAPLEVPIIYTGVPRDTHTLPSGGDWCSRRHPQEKQVTSLSPSGELLAPSGWPKLPILVSSEASPCSPLTGRYALLHIGGNFECCSTLQGSSNKKEI